MHNFQDKVVLITGGGTGIGKATAKAFSQAGAKVVITGRRESVLQETSAELGSSVEYIVADAMVPESSELIVSQTLAKHGSLDVLVNNAGILAMGPLSDTSNTDIENVYRTNVFAPLQVSRASIESLAKSQGSIVNVSSVMSQAVMPGSALYSSTKAALDHITRTLAAELGPIGIRVNAVAPGLTKTDMSAGFRSDEDSVNGIVAQTPLGRLGDPQEIAKAIVQLASEDSSWITGQIVQASGGFML